ncbi:hypothetical protein EGW08_020524 [Elysia chlorotica]|uniref:Uncharacterized protein n=1 Tax=Elysia chlorotica TaxID=188477 RepID=A0A3S1ATJ5_ELYCH|nr:hypothetical protein EGW08_020524 [Elysia chlorotica]
MKGCKKSRLQVSSSFCQLNVHPVGYGGRPPADSNQCTGQRLATGLDRPCEQRHSRLGDPHGDYRRHIQALYQWRFLIAHWQGGHGGPEVEHRLPTQESVVRSPGDITPYWLAVYRRDLSTPPGHLQQVMPRDEVGVSSNPFLSARSLGFMAALIAARVVTARPHLGDYTDPTSTAPGLWGDWRASRWRADLGATTAAIYIPRQMDEYKSAPSPTGLLVQIYSTLLIVPVGNEGVQK